ncbi:hypothetical protein VPHD249_0131 [Vibrio phage D249]
MQSKLLYLACWYGLLLVVMTDVLYHTNPYNTLVFYFHLYQNSYLLDFIKGSK